MVILLNQLGLILGFLSALVLLAANKVGVVSKDGSLIFSGLDPMDDVDDNIKRVRDSHRRYRVLRPLGLILLALSFVIQFFATLV